MKAEQPPQAGTRPAFQLLTEVSEEAATGGLANTYADIQRVFGVSLAATMFRALGPYPQYLEHAWRALRPNALSPAFDSGANQIRAEAVRLVSQWPAFGCDVPLLARLGYLGGDVEHLRAGMGTFHYLNPQLLQWVAALRLARESPIGQSAAPRGLGEPEGGRPAPLHLVAPRTAPPEVAARYQWLQKLLGAPVVTSEFQFLGGYPTYLYQLFPSLQDLINAQGFQRAAQSLGALSTRLASHLPYWVQWESAQEEPEQRADLFYELLPRLILVVALINRRLGCSQEYYMR